ILAIDLSYHHAPAHASLIGFAARVNLCHDDPLRAIVTQLPGYVRWEVLHTEPQLRRWLRLLLFVGTCGLLARQFPKLNREIAFFVLSQDLHGGLRVRSSHRHDVTQMPGVLHGVAIERHNDIAPLKARLGRWRIRRYV